MAGLLAVVGTGVFLWPILFGGSCSLAFGTDDVRIDLRPWARVDAGGALGAINPATPDVVGLVLPGLVAAQQALASGGAPWWDEGQLLGHPSAANMPFPVTYPVAWPLLAADVDPVTLLDLFLFFHTVVALFLSYRACRELGARAPFACAGAVGFALSAWMFTRWHCPQMLWASVWWPGQLVALELLRRGKVARAVLEGALFTALALLAGFPQVGFVMTGSIAVLALVDRELRTARRLATLGVMLGAGFALAAPQLAVSSSAFAASLRSNHETRVATAQRGLDPASLVGAVLPGFFGHPPDFATADPPAPTMERWLPQRRWLRDELQNNVTENALYPGVLILLLAAVALGRHADPRARRLALLAASTVAAAIVVPRLASSVPQLAAFAAGNIKRALALPAACLPIAAALSLQSLARGQGRVPVRASAALTALVVALVLLGSWVDDPQAQRFSADLRSEGARQLLFIAASLLALFVAFRARPDRWFARVAPWLPAAILAVDLGAQALAYNPFVPQPSEAYPTTRTTDALAARGGRVAVFGGGIQHLLPAGAALHGVRSVGGVAPMLPRRSIELLECVEPGLVEHRDPRLVPPFRQPESRDHPVLDLLGVETIVFTDPAFADTSGLPLLFEHHQEALAAVTRPRAGPRAFRCAGARVAASPAERLELLAARDFPVHRTVLLERAPELALPEVAPSRASAVPVRRERDRGGDSYVLDAAGEEPGVVVLTEAWDPGWSVRVDGEAAALHIVDHALVGVCVAAGAHEVVFRYEPPGWRSGLLVSLSVSLALAGLALASVRQAMRRKTHDAH